MNPILIISGIALLVVQAAKKTGLPNKYLPFFSLGVGLVAGLIGTYAYGSAEFIWIGIYSGAMASGVFDNLKAITTIQSDLRK